MARQDFKKISISDLLIAKNNQHKRKDSLKKFITGDSLEMLTNRNTKSHNTIMSNQRCGNDKICRDISNINVLMAGQSLMKNFDNFSISIVNVREDVTDGLSMLYNGHQSKQSGGKLAIVSNIGTSHKYNFATKPGKLIPISTLKSEFKKVHQQTFEKTKSRVTNRGDAQLSTEDPGININQSVEIEERGEAESVTVKQRSKIRSVEEIIESLKSDDYMLFQQESDERISKLINRVLQRTEEEKQTDSLQEAEIQNSATEGYEIIEQDASMVDQSKTPDKFPLPSTSLAPAEKGEMEKQAELNLVEIENETRQLEGVLDAISNQSNICDSRMMTLRDESEKYPNETESIEFNLESAKEMSVISEDESGDFMLVRGRNLETKPPDEPRPFLMDRDQDVSKKDVHQSIHSLCTVQFPICEPDSRKANLWVDQYISNKFPYHPVSQVEGASEQDQHDLLEKEIIFELLGRKTMEMEAYNSDLAINGKGIIPEHLKIHDFWQPRTVKLKMNPKIARLVLCPTYHEDIKEPPFEAVSTRNTLELLSSIELQRITEMSLNDEDDLNALETKEKLIRRRNDSLGIVHENDSPQSVHSNDRKRSSSLPNRHWLEENDLIIRLDYHQIMDEISIQKRNILQLLMQSKDDNEQIEPKTDEDEDTGLLDSIEVREYEQTIQVEEIYPSARRSTIKQVDGLPDVAKNEKEELELTDAQKSLLAGMNYVYYPPKKTNWKSKKSKKSIQRIAKIEEFLNQTPNKVARTVSFSTLFGDLKCVQKQKESLSGPQSVQINNHGSLTNLQEFDNWATSYGYRQEENTRDWIKVVWDQWFDERYPLPPDGATFTSTQKPEASSLKADTELSFVADMIAQNTEINELPEKIESVITEVSDEYRDSVVQTLLDEVEKLTNEIGMSEKPNAFLLSRRGALYRKLGYLKASMEDINGAIEIEPDLLIAYWDRHLLHLMRNKIQSAIEDLNFIIKKNKNYIPAYKSRGVIYATLKNTSLAISNLTQAIRLAPNDVDAYLKRAQLYDESGDHRLALEDYNQLIQLQPDNLLATMKHGLYYINIEQWQLAIKDFSHIIKKNPLNVEARLNRGTAFAKLHQWQDALCDFSVVIHVDPNNAVAYFKRATILRQAEPAMAIRDLSLSLLLDSSDNNTMAYLYRGILYSQTKQFSEAIVDFEMVISYNKDMCCAYVNLGIVYFEKEDYEKALKYFTSGIAADPTYVRAYVCRAETYFKLNMFEHAVKDINISIHIYPDRSNYYMLRGDFYLAMGKMELAAMCVRQAAAISHNLGQSPLQQALLHAFLRNYDKAIEELLHATRNKPNIALLNLLGNIQMKALRWNAAITSFNMCLEQLKPKNQFKAWPPGSANLHFLVAQCYLELKDYEKSQESFKATIKVNPKHDEAYYQRGWCRLRLGLSKQGVLDLNKALAINPKLFHAYLARAILYGQKRKYTKAILNCNEVLAIEPRCLRAYLYRGVFKYNIKAYHLALKDFNESVKIDPNCILAYFNRAVCYGAEIQSYGKAIQDYSIVLILTDNLDLHRKAYINRGIIYMELGDIENAMQDFRAAYNKQPNDIKMLTIIGLCHHKLGNLKEAICIFSRCFDMDHQLFHVLVFRGNAFMDYNTAKSRQLALKDYEYVLNIDPDNEDALVNVGYCKQSEGKFKEAWNIFSKIIEKHPNSAAAYDGRAIVCMQMRDLNGAMKDLNAAICIDPQSSIFYTNRAVVYQLLRDGIRSMKDYSKAVLINANNAVANYNMGCVYLHNFQLNQSRESLLKAVKVNPKDEAAWMTLGLVEVFSKNVERSIEYMDKAIALRPYCAYMYQNRGVVFCLMKNFESAMVDFMKSLSLVPEDAQVFLLRGDCLVKSGDVEGAYKDYERAIFINSRTL